MGYVDSQQGAHTRTAFRNAEKQYKRYKEASTRLRSSRFGNKIQPTDVSQVLDFTRYVDAIKDRSTKIDGVSLAPECPSDLPVFVIDGHPGFHFIPQALSVEEQFHWVQESLSSFPQPPNRTNHNAEFGPIKDLWSGVKNHSVLIEVATENSRNPYKPSLIQAGTPLPSPGTARGNGVKLEHLDEAAGKLSELEFEKVPIEQGMQQGQESSSEDIGENSSVMHDSGRVVSTARLTNERAAEASKQWQFASSHDGAGKSSKTVTAESLLRRMRWATIGMQFDWSKKAYNTSLPYKKLPGNLSELAARLAAPVMGGDKFNAEAAIVNYYGPDDMLGGHVDDMEADWSKPIVSISLGCKAIFLLGGESRGEPPTAMFVRSGDVVLMSGAARSCFHGVPRIFTEDEQSALPDFSRLENDLTGPLQKYIRESRININIRQVY